MLVVQVITLSHFWIRHDIQNFANSGRCPRILELNSGPVPLLSMWASRCGARAWVSALRSWETTVDANSPVW